MPTGGALVDSFRQTPHVCNALGDLLAEQHAPAARLGALSDDNLDCVGLAQVVRVHAIARRQDLIHEQFRMLALFLRHPAVAGGGRGSDRAGATPERLLGLRGQRAEAHSGNRDRDLQRDRVLGETAADRDLGHAFLAIALERISADRRAEKQQVVEVRQLLLGAKAANVIDAGRSGAADLGDRVLIERRRLSWRRATPPVMCHQYDPTLSTWK